MRDTPRRCDYSSPVDIQWQKARDGKLVSALAGPLSLRLTPTGDGRWNWQVFNGGAPNPMATGIANSLGAAKTVATQFAGRSGLT